MRTGLVWMALLTALLVLALSLSACNCDDDDDDDNNNDNDDECIVCEGTSECTDALGTGWVCLYGCCVEFDADDDATDDDATDDDATDDDATDDDDDDDFTWTIEELDRIGPGSRQISLAIGSDETLYIAYTGCSDGSCENSDLFFAWLTPDKAVWETTVVDSQTGDLGWYPALALDDADHPHILYAEHSQTKLRYATATVLDNWTVTPLNGAGRGGLWNAAVYADGMLVTAHTSLPPSGWDGDLGFGYLTGSSWTFLDIDTDGDCGWFTEMTVTPDGRPVIAYIRGYPAGYQNIMTYDDGDWDVVQVDDGSYGGEIVVTDDGYYHLAYPKGDPQNGDLWDLWYATNAPAGEWTKVMIDGGSDAEEDTGGFPAIAADADGGLHVTYRNFSLGALMYARKAPGGDWEYDVADAIGGGLYSDVEIDGNGVLHIAYENGTKLRYAVCDNCTDY